MGFDLRSEPWIPVRGLDGGLDEVSLRDALAGSHETTMVCGELPTTGLALLRLLLAVLYRALPPTNTPVATWSGLWSRPTIPMGDVDAYLAYFGDRFDLLHPKMPFLQVADLATARGTTGDLLPLIADVPNGRQFFTTRAGAGVTRLTFAEAARWVVHCQAYDPSGIKSGAVGDPRVKGGKGYPIGVGWAGALGGIAVEGRTLRETLLLNLALTTRGGEPLADGDSAVWERPPLTAAPEHADPRAPAGPADVLTWPSRRIRLAHDGQHVTGVLICNGDRLSQQDQFTEPMTAWRRSPAQEKSLKRTLVYMPLTHNPDRSVWRGLAAILPLDPPAVGDGADRLAPLVLQFLRGVQSGGDRGPIRPDYPIRTRAVGLIYGSNNAVVAELVDDALAVHAVLLAESGRPLRQAALEAVTAADHGALAVADLAGNLTAAAGGEQANARQQARELYFFSLDSAFRAWLGGLREDTDPPTALQAWQVTANGVAVEHERRLLGDAGPAAWTGRTLRGPGGGIQHVDAALASLWFRAALRKALPLAYPDDLSATPDGPADTAQEDGGT